MDGTEQAAAYAAADFSEPNQLFVAQLARIWPRRPAAGVVLDLGCGPADILVRILRERPGWRAIGVDGSAAMLAEARRLLRSAGLADRVTLLQQRLGRNGPGLPRAEVVISNSLLHHLADPAVLWQAVRDAGGPGAAVQVMDLLRPADERAVARRVDEYAGDAPAVLREDFRRSLHAAYTLDEVAAQLAAAGLDRILALQQVSDRHWLAAGRLPGGGGA